MGIRLGVVWGLRVGARWVLQLQCCVCLRRAPVGLIQFRKDGSADAEGDGSGARVADVCRGLSACVLNQVFSEGR